MTASAGGLADHLVVVSGPSGAGKGTLIARLLAEMPELEVTVSATTRGRRGRERDGVDYHFLSGAEFAARVARGEFLEHAEYAGNRYGTLRSEIDRIVAAGRGPVLEIELAGARAVRRAAPGALSVFIAPPSIDVLAARLRRRATDSDAEIARRLEVARGELAASAEFDHVIVNEDLERAAGELIALVRGRLAGTADGAAG